MPADTTRLQRRVTRRDRWFLAALTLAAVVGIVWVAVITPSGTSPPVAQDCVSIVRASIMGGATYVYCGDAATAACERFAEADPGLAERCEARGLVRRGARVDSGS
jgi:hypothetical protein